MYKGRYELIESLNNLLIESEQVLMGVKEGNLNKENILIKKNGVVICNTTGAFSGSLTRYTRKISITLENITIPDPDILININKGIDFHHEFKITKTVDRGYESLYNSLINLMSCDNEMKYITSMDVVKSFM